MLEALLRRCRRLRWRGGLWALLFWPVLALGEPRTALVIGNAGYRDSPLNNPVNDARDVAEALRTVGFEVIQQENLDKRGFDAAVSDFARLLQQRGGVGLFYYSGHGAQVRGENYLIPVNAAIASEADVEYEAVSAGRVLRNMEQAGNGLSIVVLDACRNNPYRGWYRSEGSKGLARMDAPTGSIIAYATAPGTVAADGTGRNSPYTAQLLQAMRAPGVGIEQLFKQVRIQVAKATDNRQVPWESSSLMGDFYFIPPGPAWPPSVKPPTPRPEPPQTPHDSPTRPPDQFRDRPIDWPNTPRPPSTPEVATTPTLRMTATVVEFQVQGGLGLSQQAGAIIADLMMSAIANTGRFVLRDRLPLSAAAKIAKLQELGSAGLLDPKTAAELGRLNGLDAIVIGRVSKRSDLITVVARLIDTKTASLLRSGQIQGKDVDTIQVKLNELAAIITAPPEMPRATR